MAKKTKRGLLPSLEILIILVFFFSFIVWAVTRCNATKESFQEEEPVATAPKDSISNEIPGASNQAGLADSTSNIANNSRFPDPRRPVSRENYTTLYVIIENLNMRTNPSLKSPIIMRLSKDEEVAFMNEVTNFTEEINMGEEIANEPWIKVKAKKGHIGWVYGAGVHYYKEKPIPLPTAPPAEPEN